MRKDLERIGIRSNNDRVISFVAVLVYFVEFKFYGHGCATKCFVLNPCATSKHFDFVYKVFVGYGEERLDKSNGSVCWNVDGGKESYPTNIYAVKFSILTSKTNLTCQNISIYAYFEVCIPLCIGSSFSSYAIGKNGGR